MKFRPLHDRVVVKCIDRRRTSVVRSIAAVAANFATASNSGRPRYR